MASTLDSAWVPPDKVIIKEAVGKTFRHLRERQGISQEELGLRCRVHRTFVGAIERGEQNPSIVVVLKLLEGLGVSFASFARRLEKELALLA